MGLTDDYARAHAGRRIQDWRDTVVSEIQQANADIDNHLAAQYGFIQARINHCTEIGQKFIALRDEFPDDVDEINALLQQGITALNTLKTRYETEVG